MMMMMMMMMMTVNMILMIILSIIITIIIIAMKIEITITRIVIGAIIKVIKTIMVEMMMITVVTIVFILMIVILIVIYVTVYIRQARRNWKSVLYIPPKNGKSLASSNLMWCQMQCAFSFLQMEMELFRLLYCRGRNDYEHCGPYPEYGHGISYLKHTST